MTEPPNDPWENAPRMSPEQGGPPGAPPPPGYAPPPPPGYAPPPPPGAWGQQQPQYGGPPQYGAPPGYGGYQRAPSNGLGTGALVCGIIGLVLSFVIIGGLVGAVAVILGVMGLGKVKRQEATNRGAAIAGIVTGGLAVLVAGLILVVAVVLSDEIGTYTECVEQATTQAEIDQCATEFEDSIGQ